MKLAQGRWKATTRKELNFAVTDGRKLGALSFEVPTMALLLDSMGDKQSFDIQFEGQSVAHIGWTDGFTAHDHLCRCVVARR